VRLKVAPHLADDIHRLNAYSLEALNVVSEKVDDFHVERTDLQEIVAKTARTSSCRHHRWSSRLREVRRLMRFAQQATVIGPILFLKNDRLAGTGMDPVRREPWLVGHGCRAAPCRDRICWHPILFIDGIDRVRPTNKGSLLIS